MLLPDVNVMVYAHRPEAVDHHRYRGWLDEVLRSDAPFGIADAVLTGFVRIVTHPRIFRTPTPLDIALTFAAVVRDRPNAVLIAPADRHWDIFVRLCTTAGAKGNLVADAYLAALAIESGCEWVTTDRDYARFEGLQWRHPLAGRTGV